MSVESPVPLPLQAGDLSPSQSPHPFVSALSSKRRPLARVAARLYAALGDHQQRPIASSALDRLLHRIQELPRLRKRYRACLQRRWHSAERFCQRELMDLMSEATHLLSEQVAVWRQTHNVPIVQPPDQILQDILSLEEEFDDVVWDAESGSLAISTQAIELESVPLGRFRIALDLKRLLIAGSRTAALRVDALDPNPASCDDSITHPHVRDGTPCLGDASRPIEHALTQGRITDAFRLVERVLHTYNESSPYHRLDQWQGVECQDCGRPTDAEASRSCSMCEQTLCGGCELCCDECGGGFCRSCLERTADRQHYYCEDCRGTCCVCGAVDASSRLKENDELCDACREAQDEAQDEAADEAAEEAAGEGDSSSS